MPTVKPLKRIRHGAPAAALVLAALAALAALAGACQSGDEARAFRGVALSAPMAKPAFTLPDVNGRPFDFVAETRDRVALIFFGYTHCPDICPLHMANIAAVLKQMSFEERQRIVTVFVTTDPERDTPERLKSWLANFDPSFVGLTGTPDELAAGRAPATRFEAPAGLDLAALAAHLGAQVEQLAVAGDRATYAIGAEGTPTTLAALTAWLAERDLPLDDLRTGGPTLEEAFLELTGLDLTGETAPRVEEQA